MNVRAMARVAGLIGGGCWVARLLLDRTAGGGEMVDLLYWVGLVPVFVALFGLGTMFVNKGEIWLQVIVGIAFPLLVWSLVEVLHAAADPALIDAVVGLLIAGAALRVLGHSGSGDEKPPRRHAGAHAR